MTEVASRAAQAQSILDAVSRPAPSKSAGSRPAAKAFADDGSNDQVRDRFVDKKDVRDRFADSKPVGSETKVSQKAHRDDSDDEAEASFEATIDTLDSQTSTGNVQGPPPANPAIWGAERPVETVQGPASNETGPSASAIPGHMLKQASVIALLDARQRMMAAQDMPATETPREEEETVAIPVEIKSREAHWLFEDGQSGSSTRVFDALARSESGENPLPALNAATNSKNEHDPVKVSKDAPLAVSASEQKAADGSSAQQNFTGAQDGRSGSREQQGAADAGPRRILDAAATAPSEQVSRETPDTPDTMSAATQQVRSGVLNALADERSHSEALTPRQPTDRPPVAGQVLRAIDLTLSPPDLGTVRLKLSLKASALDIDAEASKAATARLLDDDRKGLEQSLRDAGYDVKSLKISDVSSTSSSNLNSSLNNGASSFQDGNQARGNLAGRQDDGLPRREGGTPDQSQQRRRDDNQKSSGVENGSARQANAIYI